MIHTTALTPHPLRIQPIRNPLPDRPIIHLITIRYILTSPRHLLDLHRERPRRIARSTTAHHTAIAITTTASSRWSLPRIALRHLGVQRRLQRRAIVETRRRGIIRGDGPARRDLLRHREVEGVALARLAGVEERQRLRAEGDGEGVLGGADEAGGAGGGGGGGADGPVEGCECAGGVRSVGRVGEAGPRGRVGGAVGLHAGEEGDEGVGAGWEVGVAGWDAGCAGVWSATAAAACAGGDAVGGGRGGAGAVDFAREAEAESEAQGEDYDEEYEEYEGQPFPSSSSRDVLVLGEAFALVAF